MKTTDAAIGRWPGILRAFGLDESMLTGKHCPCPVCGGRDRFRFDDKDGKGTWICSHCGSGTGIKLLMEVKGWDFKQAAGEVDRIIGGVQIEQVKTPKKNPVDRLKKIAAGLAPMDTVNPVRAYLHGRGLQPTKAVRYHPGLNFYDGDRFVGTFPAMVCVVESPEGKPLTFHVTYITREGAKAPVSAAKKIMTPVGPTQGGAIRLYPVTEHIGLAEGIETALAVTRDYGVPCWAAANAGLMEKFQPPEGVKAVTIFGDNDLNFVGQKAAYTLAHRLAGIVDVRVVIPNQPGADFAEQGATA
jgi:putative DNA primase/helicase